MKPFERLLKYVTFTTPSDEFSKTVPSTACQFELAHYLADELHTLGISDAEVDEKCYLYAHIPATPRYEDRTRIGFVAHMDTVSDFCDHPAAPQIHENYDGGPLVLKANGPESAGESRILSPDMFPHLRGLSGRTLITTDGTTILGADDKAGIAEIMTLAETLMTGEIPHGPVSIAFTPDEEIGMGASHFDIKKFNADFAYTLDGDSEGEIQFENFNACRAEFDVTGINVHPGSSKDVMVNASLIAMEINTLLPPDETPRGTAGYEGFYHLTDMEGDVAHALLRYIIRDHSAISFEERKKRLYEIEKQENEKWGAGTVKLNVTEQYCNMAEIINKHHHLIDNAKTACENAGVTPLIIPIRGGTDGATLSYMGVPCPNLGTGGYCFHGPYEHVTVEGMDAAYRIALELVKIYANLSC